MIIKKYVANTLEDAMDLLRKELGPDAVVLTTRHMQSKGFFSWFSSGRIEVTAAVDEPDLRAFTERKEGKQVGKHSQLEKKPSSPALEGLSNNLAELKQSLKQEVDTTYGDPRLQAKKGADQISLSADARRLRQTAAHQEQKVPAKKTEDFAAGILHASQGLLAAFGESSAEEEVSPRRASSPSADRSSGTPVDKRGGDAETLRLIVREEMQRARQSVSVGSTAANDESTVGSVRFLMGKGIVRSVAVDVEQKLVGQFGVIDLNSAGPKRRAWLNRMKVELEKLVLTKGPLTLKANSSTVVALVGPHGVGKTTTLAKIAQQYSRDLGRRVGVISIDTEKTGAREQIRGLTDQLQLPLLTAGDRAELGKAVETFADRQLILIDTAGCSQYHRAGLNVLAELLSVVAEVQIILTLSATTKDVDVIGAAQRFTRMPIDSLIFTKLDETIAHGIIINVCQKTKLPVRYLTSGSGFAGKLMVAEPAVVARNLLLENNAEEYDALRRLVSA